VAAAAVRPPLLPRPSSALGAVESLPRVAASVVYAGPEGEGEERAAVVARDGRPAREALTLDSAGFQLIDVDAPIAAAFADPADVCAKVYPEAARHVARATGAHKVLVFDHVLRDFAKLQREADAGIKRSDPRATPLLARPVRTVHNDYTVRSGFTRARQLLEPYVPEAQLEEALRGRFAIVNFWYPLETVRSAPLGLCHWASCRPADVRTTRLVYEHRLGETYRVLRSSEHVWVHFPLMGPEEAILLKTFDSRAEGVARFALHAALNAPEPGTAAAPAGTGDAGAPPPPAGPQGQGAAAQGPSRRSLEVRCLVFLDRLPEGFAEGYVPPHLLPGSPDADGRVSLKGVEVLPASGSW